MEKQSYRASLHDESDSEPFESKTIETNSHQESSSSYGFVILTSKRPVSRGKKDAEIVSEWFSGRLNRMQIKPKIFSFDDPPESESELSQGSLKSQRKQSKGKFTVKDNDNRSHTGSNFDDQNQDSILDFGLSKDPIPVWKFLAKQQIKEEQELRRELTSPHISDNYDQSDSNLIKKCKKKKKLKKKDNVNNKLEILEETFKTKSSLEDGVWVVIIDTPFKSLVEIDQIEAMGVKYNFRILVLNAPYKTNILRMLGDIAEEKEKVLKKKQDPVNSAFEEAVIDTDWNQNKEETLATIDSRHSYNSYKNKREHFEEEIKNQNEAEEEEEELSQDDMIILQSQATLRSSISSPSIKDLEATFGRISKGVCEDGSGTSNNVLANEDSYDDDTSSGESDTSSVFEMGEDNLFMCMKQASKIIIPPPVSPRLFFQSFENRDSSKTRALVVIMRDLEHDKNNNFSLSRALKEKLKRYKIKSYVISISNLMKDLQAIQVMKGYANRIAMSDRNNFMTDGYGHLILAVLADKMAKKSKKVVIIDLGDEKSLRLWPVRDFCIRSHAEVMTLERLPDEPFDSKLFKLTKEIHNRYKNFDWNAFPFSKEAMTAMSHQELTPLIPHPQQLDITEDSNLDEDDQEEKSSQPAFDSQSEFDESDLNDTVKLPDFVPKFEEESRLESQLDQVRQRLRRKSENDTQIEKVGADSKTNCLNSLTSKKKLQNSKRNLIANSSHKILTKEQRSLYALRRNVPNSNSSDSSVHTKEVFSQRPKLLKIQKISDGKAPSTTFSKLFDISKQPSMIDEEYLYKGWVAVPQDSSKPLVGIERFVRNTGVLMMRILRPVGSFLTCKYCREPIVAKVAPQSPPRQQRHYKRRNQGIIKIPSIDEYYNNN